MKLIITNISWHFQYLNHILCSLLQLKISCKEEKQTNEQTILWSLKAIFERTNSWQYKYFLIWLVRFDVYCKTDASQSLLKKRIAYFCSLLMELSSHKRWIFVVYHFVPLIITSTVFVLNTNANFNILSKQILKVW